MSTDTRVDIRLVWDRDLGECDLQFVNSDLICDPGLETAVLISLFTDQRAEDDDALPDPNAPDRRGWWGDMVSNIEGDKIGSRLWLLERSKATQTNLELMRVEALKALQWMVDDGVASAVDVEVEGQFDDITEYTAALHVRVWRNDGSLVEIEAQ